MSNKHTVFRNRLWGLIASLAVLVATASVGAACCYTAYQPAVPKELLDR